MADKLTLKETEIEITPEMIEAGAAELVGFDGRYDFVEDGVVRIFSEMIYLARIRPD